MIRTLAIGIVAGACLLAACGAEKEPDKGAAAPAAGEQAAPAPQAGEGAMSGQAESSEPGIADVITLDKVIAGDQRSDREKARDRYRHPLKTLEFFGLQPNINVVEIWPGIGWYTDVIAPFVAGHGHYTAAIFDEQGGPPYGPKLNKALKDKIAADPQAYGEVTYTVLGKGKYDIAPPDSADMVLTFRNVHNWMAGGYAQDVFNAMYKVLKPGGILGVVEHRGDADLPQDPKAASGYVTEQTVIDMAESAGFQLVDRSNVNANPADTKDYPDGVWTLPPTLRKGDEDRAKYERIGESDRMTLKFVKPRTEGLALLSTRVADGE